MPERTYPYRAWTIGRLVITTTRQGANAPVLDGCTTSAADGWTAGGWCIRHRPAPGRGLVIAWRGHHGPTWPTIRRLTSTPGIRRLFTMRTR